MCIREEGAGGPGDHALVFAPCAWLAPLQGVVPVLQGWTRGMRRIVGDRKGFGKWEAGEGEARGRSGETGNKVEGKEGSKEQ